MKIKIAESIAKLDKWLDTMRCPGGYGGPVSHWWESSFIYTGVEVDWRYEGIITGYLNIYQKTGAQGWLEKAIRGGEDVVRNQLPSKKFLNSSFQHGPIEGGTPHEAAVDIALLELAKTLKRQGDDRWKKYFKSAEENIKTYLIGELWNGKGFMDQSWESTLVPNKNATALEALVLYSELSGKNLFKYIYPATQVILGSQVLKGERFGGVIHRGTKEHELTIGVYTARCVSGLARLYNFNQDEGCLERIEFAVEFLKTLVTEKGTYFGHYKNGSMIKCPVWISPSGDVLRALILAMDLGIKVKKGIKTLLVKAILSNQYRSGGIRTAFGFADKGSTQEYDGLPDFRDVLPVVGWCDKVFRALSILLEEAQTLPNVEIEKDSVNCLWKGKKCKFIEDEHSINLQQNSDKLYIFRKGEIFPRICNL